MSLIVDACKSPAQTKHKSFVWKEISQKYGPNTHSLFVGPVKVGSVWWNGSRSKNNEWVFACVLPGMKIHEGKAATIEPAQQRIEKQVTAWFKAVLE